MPHHNNPLALRNNLSVSHIYTTYEQNFPQGFHFSGERHNFWEIGYVIGGEVGITCDNKIYECSKGDLIVHPPNYFHTCWSLNKSSFSIFTISFQGDNIEQYLHATMLKLNKEQQVIIKALIAETKKCFSNTNGEFYYNEENPLSPYCLQNTQVLKNYLEILCVLIAANEPITLPTTRHAVKYKEIVNFLKNNVCRNLTLEDIAKELFESPVTLKRIFHKYTNLGIMRYYNELRIDYALKLLQEDVSINQIAAIMNFSSQNYFSSFFKKALGVPPTKYKKMLAKK